MGSKSTELFLISRDQTFLAQFRPELRSLFHLVLAADGRVIANTLKGRMISVALVDMNSYVENAIATLKKLNPQIKIIAVSHPWSPEKDLYALEQEVDLSMPAPRDIRQLLLRIRHLAQAQKPNSHPVPLPFARQTAPLRFEQLLVFPSEYLVRRNNDIVNITPTQFRLLITFLSHRNRLLTREWLKELVWQGSKISLRSIDAQVSKLKKSLPELDQPLLNIYGEGYILNDADKKSA